MIVSTQIVKRTFPRTPCVSNRYTVAACIGLELRYAAHVAAFRTYANLHFHGSPTAAIATVAAVHSLWLRDVCRQTWLWCYMSAHGKSDVSQSWLAVWHWQAASQD